MRKVLWALGIVVCGFFIARTIAEPFMIDMTESATYRDDWGGPSLAGVLAVHCGPGVLAAALLGWAVGRRGLRKNDQARVRPGGAG